jgi:flagellar biosynthetic protein FlhB
MAADSSQDKKLPASHRKLQKAREEGQVARSRDLGHFGAIGAGVALVALLAPEATASAGRLLSTGLRFDATLLAHPALMLERLAVLGAQMLLFLLPLFAVMLVVAVASGVLSGGWNFTLQPLTPDFSKINPITGIGRVFSGHQLTETLKACLLALVLATVGAVYLGQRWHQHAELLSMPLPAALVAGGELILSGLLLVAGVLALFALVDVPLQRFMLQRRLRMSVQEMKQEFKEAEGSPEIKSRLRARMRELANRRMLAAVPLADLVVMNPTHYAVALKYDDSKMAAPRVVAKGADLLAFKIRDLAKDAKVPVLQMPPLARALYAHTEVDQEIPARLFGAVAQVLAWVYQLRDAMAAGRGLAAEPPTPEVPEDMDPLNNPTGALNKRVEPEL